MADQSRPMSKILITGASGFIGKRLIDKLQNRYELFCLVRQSSWGAISSEANLIEQDLTRPLDISRLPGQLDAIIHLAQSRHYRQFPEQAEDIFKVNIHGTFQLLEYARRAGVKCFIFASSGGVYGYSYEKFVETDPVSPLNFYLSSKYMAELLIANYQQFFRTVVFRFFFVYGPGQQGMLVPTLLNKVKGGETITVEGNPGLRINPIYVEDVIRVFEPALQLPGSELFNVGGDEMVTITDLVELMGRVLNKDVVIRHTDTNRAGDLVGNNKRMKEVLGVQPQVSLFDGLRLML